MSGYNFSYKVYKKYVVDIFEYYEDTNFTRAFVYKKNSIGRDLIEIMDFPSETEKKDILEEAGEFIKALEKLVNPPKARKKSPLSRNGSTSADKNREKIKEKSMDDL